MTGSDPLDARLDALLNVPRRDGYLALEPALTPNDPLPGRTEE